MILLSDKKYKRESANRFLIIINLIMLLAIIGTIIQYLISKDAVFIILVIFLVLMIFMTLSIHYFIRSQNLIVSDKSITLYYRTFSESKEYNGVNFKGLKIEYNQIIDVKIRIEKPILFLTKETTWVRFFLNNGKDFETSFACFKSENQIEIISKLESIY